MPAIFHALRQRPDILIQPLIVFVTVMVAALVARKVLLRGLRAWTSRVHSRPAEIVLEALPGPTIIWSFILAVHLAVEASDVPAGWVHWIARGLLALFIFSLTLVSMQAAGNIVRHYGSAMPGALPVTTLTQNLAKLAILILGILLMLTALDAQIAPILTALGVGGLAVALALQDTLSNLFAGFYVSIAGQIRLGDYIKLNTGEEGYVCDITWRSTAIRSLSSNLIVVPNSKLGQAIVTNYHLPKPSLWSSVQVSVPYSEDPDRVERILLEVAAAACGEVPGMDAAPAPGVSLDPGFADSSIAFTVGYYVSEFSRQTAVRHELRKRIWRRFRQEGIAFALPESKVHIQPPPAAG